MKHLINKTTLFTANLNSQTVRVILTLSSLIIFSLIAGAPFDGGGNG